MLNAAVGLGVKDRSAELAALAPEAGADSPANESRASQVDKEEKADPHRAEFLKRIQAAIRQAQALRDCKKSLRAARGTGVLPVGPTGVPPPFSANSRRDACRPHSRDGRATIRSLLFTPSLSLSNGFCKNLFPSY